jgi:hypothetical protein
VRVFRAFFTPRTNTRTNRTNPACFGGRRRGCFALASERLKSQCLSGFAPFSNATNAQRLTRSRFRVSDAAAAIFGPFCVAVDTHRARPSLLARPPSSLENPCIPGLSRCFPDAPGVSAVLTLIMFLYNSGQNLGGCAGSEGSQPHLSHLYCGTPAGFDFPHSAQNFPLLTAPQLQVQPAGASGFVAAAFRAEFSRSPSAPQAHFQLPSGAFGSGFFAPHSGQNFPVAVAPHAHFQVSAAGAAGAACCWAPIWYRFWAFIPPGTGHIHAHKRHGGACALITGRGLHGTGLCADKMRSCAWSGP